MDAQLYDAANIDMLPWPDTVDAEYARRHLVPLIKNSVSSYIDNIKAEVFALKAGNIVVPLIITNPSAQNAWVCSPKTQFIDYGLDYLSLIKNPLLAGLVKASLKGLNKWAVGIKLDAVAFVNNWLFAVDLFPEGFSGAHIEAIRDLLTKRFPSHAIVFRSLTPPLHLPLMKAFKRSRFRLMTSRYIHLTKACESALFKTRILKSDLKLLRESPYEVVSEAKIPQEQHNNVLDLYRSLYITQHSLKNPQLNSFYIKMLIDNSLLSFTLVKRDGKIRGVAGHIERNGVFLCPFFGYEKDDPDHKTVYRLLNTALLLEAHKKGLLFHQSAGAAFYKTIRRAQGDFEYNAVYTRHLPFKQKMGWATIRTLINTVAPPFMKKY